MTGRKGSGNVKTGNQDQYQSPEEIQSNDARNTVSTFIML